MLKKFITIFFTVLFCLTVYGVASNAQDTDRLFNEGNRLYQQEDFRGAVEQYKSALNSGFESFELYYNIGNAFFKQGEMGQAILYFEKARRINPDDEDLRNNIQLANINIVDRITPIPEVFYTRYWNGLQSVWSPGQWKVLFFLAWFFTGITVSLLFFLKQRETRRILKAGLITSGVIVVLAGAVLLSNIMLDKSGISGVVMRIEVYAYASPTETGTEVFIIHEGTVVDIRRTMDEWIEIRLADGKIGWIPAATIEKI